MTTASPMATAISSDGRAARPIHEPGPVDLLRGEWTKIRSVRSTTWSLLAMAAASLGLTIIATSLYTARWSSLDASSRAQFRSDTIGLIFQPASSFGQVAVCVLGVLFIASEYSTGMIRSSMLAAPRRTPVLAAKAVVFAGLTFVVAELVALPCFFIGSAITGKYASTSITDLTDLRAVVGFGVFMSLTGLIALAVGTLVRNPAGGISLILALQFVVPAVLSLIPGSLGEHLSGAMPANTNVILGSGHDAESVFSPAQGLALLLAWTVVLMAGAWVSIKRRDV
ncbi:MAG: ABC transporter permease [Frankia sp.]